MTRRATWVLTVALLGAVVFAWWSIPAATGVAFDHVPALSEERLIELKANGVHTARIRGLHASTLVEGTTVRLVAGYMDDRRFVLFVRSDPPARLASGNTTTLRDQFGRSYASHFSVADMSTGEQMLFFEAPRFPLLLTGARLWLESSQMSAGANASEMRDVRLSLATILLTDYGSLASFLRSMAMNYVVLAAVGAVFLGLVHGIARLVPIGADARRAYLRGVTTAVVFAVTALPTFIAVAVPFRYDPVGIGGGPYRPFEGYWLTARALFFVLEALAVVIAILRATIPARWAVPVAAGVTTVAFLVLTLPLAEIANACYVGRGFILEPSC